MKTDFNPAMKRFSCSTILLPTILFIFLLNEGASLTVFSQGNNITISSIINFPWNNSFLEFYFSAAFHFWRNYTNSPVDFTLFTLLQGPHCLLTVTNFLSVDIVNAKAPLVIRRPTPVTIREARGSLKAIVAAHKWLLLEREPCIPKEIYCPLIFGKTSASCDYEDHCGKLDYFRLAHGSSKLWTCELSVGLFPPHEIKKLRKEEEHGVNAQRFKYPHLWNYNSVCDMLECRQVTRSIPTLQIFIVPELNKSEMEHNFVLKWIHDLEMKAKLSQTFLLAKINKQGKAEMTLDLVAIANSTQLKFYSLPFDIKIQNFTYLTSTFPANWTLDTYDSKLGQFETHYVEKSGLHHSHRNLDMLSVAANVWKAIIQNKSYFLTNLDLRWESRRISRNKLRQYKITSKLVVRSEWTPGLRPLHRPLYLPALLNSLRFVICGPKTVKEMAFLELVNVYEPEVWIWLGITIIAAAFSWKILMGQIEKLDESFKLKSGQNKASPLKIMCVFLKSLVEQGDSMSSNMFLGFSPIRLIFGSFLLIAIVLSNGYKNTNVYNMVQPRKLLKYEKFEELVNDSVPAFILASPDLQLRFEPSLTKKEFLLPPKGSLRYGNYVKSYQTPDFSMKLKTPFNSMTDTSRILYRDRKELELDKLVANQSRLLPTLFFTESEAKSYEMREFIPRFSQLKKDYAKREKADARKSLRECRRVAFVMEEGDAEPFLGGSGKKEVYAGEEFYQPRSIQFWLEGRVTPEVLKRLAEFGETGIVNMWMGLLENVNKLKQLKEVKKDETGDSPTAATMEGQIAVIFSLLGTGLCATILTLILEFATIWRRKCPLFGKDRVVSF